MSLLSQFYPGSGIKSVQTGYADGVNTTSGSGEDNRFVNVSINSVNTGKCILSIMMLNDVFYTTRLTSNTNLRVSTVNNSLQLTFRWYVYEFY